MDQILDLVAEHRQKLAIFASTVAVVLMALSVANAVLFVIDNMDDSTMSKAGTSSPAVQTRPGNSVNVASLNLFGVAEAEDAPRVIDAPQTNLNLELQGVFTAADPDESTAIVAERNKTGELYQIGDRLPGNATLDAVFDDHILIKRGARLEKLMFSDAQVRQQFSPSQISPSQISPSQSADTLSPPSSTRLQNLRERIEARRAASQTATTEPPASDNLRAHLTSYRDRLSEDPQKVLNEIGIAPVAQGQASGYRIAGEVPEQILNQAGLQRGDVVLSVNGTPVGNIGNDQALIDQALAAGRVRVEIQRNERKFYLTVPIP